MHMRQSDEGQPEDAMDSVRNVSRLHAVNHRLLVDADPLLHLSFSRCKTHRQAQNGFEHCSMSSEALLQDRPDRAHRHHS